MSTVTPDPVRVGIIAAFLPKLTQMANDAVASGKRRDEFVLVCIDADEAPWGELVRKARPQSELQEHRDAGKMAIILGVMPSEFATILARAMPRFADALTGLLPSDYCRCICLANGGITVWYLRPAVAPDKLN